ncbi:MAG: hypothetical protein OJF47_002513 [Nitrospira sp.]|jgi:hypothetical protein|nr:MAG: hypothetical protein OJF47_002513 [Nitrospira sp.]
MDERPVRNHPASGYAVPLYGGALILCGAVTIPAEDAPSFLSVPTEGILASEIQPLGDPIGWQVMGWNSVTF